MKKPVYLPVYYKFRVTPTQYSGRSILNSIPPFVIIFSFVDICKSLYHERSHFKFRPETILLNNNLVSINCNCDSLTAN